VPGQVEEEGDSGMAVAGLLVSEVVTEPGNGSVVRS
jgi:hypothetical protein